MASEQRTLDSQGILEKRILALEKANQEANNTAVEAQAQMSSIAAQLASDRLLQPKVAMPLADSDWERAEDASVLRLRTKESVAKDKVHKAMGE